MTDADLSYFWRLAFVLWMVALAAWGFAALQAIWHYRWLDSPVLLAAWLSCLIAPFVMGATRAVKIFMRATRARREGRMTEWKVTFICCGRENGSQIFDSWEDADALRESYCANLEHDRSAIITKMEGE